MKNKAAFAAYWRIGLVFLALTLFASAVMLIFLTRSYRERMENTAARVLDSSLFQTAESLNTILLNDDWSSRMFALTQDMAELSGEGIYGKAVLYDRCKGEIIASSGSYVEMMAEDSTWRVVPLGDSLTAAQINRLFYNTPNKFAHGELEIDGYDTGAAVLPKTLRRVQFGTVLVSEEADAENTQGLPSITLSSEGQGYSFWLESFLNRGYISAADERRYQTCRNQIHKFIEADATTIAQQNPSSRENTGLLPEGAASYSPSLFPWFNAEMYAAQGVFLSGGVSDDPPYVLYYAALYYPLERALTDLSPVLAILFAVMTGAAIVLANRLAAADLQKRRLEESRRHLINSAAHELKTPLAVIAGYAEALRDRIDESKREQYLQTILQETDSMNTTVMDLLTLSRLESGKIQPNWQNCDLTALSEEVVAAYRELLIQKNIRLTTEYMSAGRQCSADPALIRRVMSNFLSNAVRHTPEGGWIKISIHTTLLGLWYEVENQGERIPPEKLRNIWDAFYKTDDARARAGGSGMGLTIARHILEMHGWNYYAQNNADSITFGFQTK